MIRISLYAQIALWMTGEMLFGTFFCDFYAAQWVTVLFLFAARLFGIRLFMKGFKIIEHQFEKLRF